MYVVYKPKKSRQKFCENLRVFYHNKDSFTAMISLVFCHELLMSFLSIFNELSYRLLKKPE